MQGSVNSKSWRRHYYSLNFEIIDFCFLWNE